MHAREIQNFVTLSTTLDQVRLNDQLEDFRIWNHNRSGGFSCKSANEAFQHEEGFQDFHFHKFIWKSNIPARIKLFAWSFSLKKINTADILQRKRSFWCLQSSWCIMCKQNQESILNLFIQCDLARRLWLEVFSEFGALIEMPNNLLDLLNECLNVP